MIIDLPERQSLLAAPDAPSRLRLERSLLIRETAMFRATRPSRARLRLRAVSARINIAGPGDPATVGRRPGSDAGAAAETGGVAAGSDGGRRNRRLAEDRSRPAECRNLLAEDRNRRPGGRAVPAPAGREAAVSAGRRGRTQARGLTVGSGEPEVHQSHDRGDERGDERSHHHAGDESSPPRAATRTGSAR